MTHFELVQTATDLMSESRNAALWLSEYDEALAASTDGLLANLVSRLQKQLQVERTLAA